ncbi:6-phosphogluconolactonase [Corynebacterium timonense]|uniref:6-phosphogluconolactonase n=1 Tax=Corynebacterium timonense TaxID=441500 RepID=A0A1H1NXR5_9CORY|nr:6-phosphogluconolactonase [Corynebacterium timonense]SDS03743.1 6-phosphogluconolactonase [Corynebacterium timonense]
MVTVCRHADLASLIDATATRLTDLLRDIHSRPDGGVSGDGVARLVLTGGGAGIGLLKELTTRDIDWSRVHVFFGDERNVSPTHPGSNEGQAREALLDRAAIPETHIHGYGLDGSAMGPAVSRYERVLAEYAPQGFDLHLLGMGGEGHINSLFPHSAAVRERDALVVAVTDSPKPPPQRASLTLPAVRRAERVWLLVAGSEKAEAAGHVAAGADPLDWPAAGAAGRAETVLHVAADAAGCLPRQ